MEGDKYPDKISWREIINESNPNSPFIVGENTYLVVQGNVTNSSVIIEDGSSVIVEGEVDNSVFILGNNVELDIKKKGGRYEEIEMPKDNETLKEIITKNTDRIKGTMTDKKPLDVCISGGT